MTTTGPARSAEIPPAPRGYHRRRPSLPPHGGCDDRRRAGPYGPRATGTFAYRDRQTNKGQALLQRGSRAIELTDGLVWGLVEAAPDGIVMVDDQGRIVLVNRQTELLFDYGRSDLVGQPVEVLLPESLRRVHGGHRARYRAEPRARTMGEGMELLGRRRDGTQFPIEISLSPLGMADQRMTIATVRDVTGRTAAEEQARRVSATLDTVQDAVFVFDVDTLRYTHVNRGAVEQLGYSRAELLGMTPLHVLPAYDADAFRLLVAPLAAQEVAAITVTTVHRRAHGEDVAVEIVLQRPFAESSGPRSFVAVARDISERVEAETQVRRVQRTLDAIWDAVYIVDGRTLEFLYVNEGATRQLGWPREQLLGMTLPEIAVTPPQDIDDQVADLLAGLEPVLRYETVHRRADGGQLAVEVMLQRPFDVADAPSWIVAVVRDQTERIRAEEELRRVRDELALTGDRERIGRDLHDTVIQQLFALGMSLQAVAGRVTPPEAAERVHATIDGLDTTIRDLRTAIFGLQARPDWGHERLRGPVLRLAVDASRSLGFEPAVRFAGDVESVSDEVAEQLLPTLGEALSNAARHARAAHVDAELHVDDDIVLRVIDDGVGGTPDPDAAQGDGLRNLRARAEALGGTCQVTPGADGTGTVVEWRVPNRRA